MIPGCYVTLDPDVQAFESSKGQRLELEVLTLLEQHLQRWRQELGIDGKQDAGERNCCFTDMLTTCTLACSMRVRPGTAAAVQMRSKPMCIPHH